MRFSPCCSSQSNLIHYYFCYADNPSLARLSTIVSKMPPISSLGFIYCCICAILFNNRHDHVHVGLYMELFRKKDVIFIAVTNNIDSAHPKPLNLSHLSTFSTILQQRHFTQNYGGKAFKRAQQQICFEHLPLRLQEQRQNLFPRLLYGTAQGI